jgi:hypothetical protein
MSFNPKTLQAGVQARQGRAVARTAALAPVINELRAAGITSRKGIATALNPSVGVPMPWDRGRWYPMQVSRF